MKKAILAVLLTISTSSLCWSDEYLLLMSKDDNVCNHMLYIFDQGLKVGEIRFLNNIKEFKVIKWDNKYATPGRERFPILVSKFDINNDGKEEIVVKREATLHSELTDELQIYNMADENLFQYDFDTKNINKRLFYIPKEQDYCLKELPRSQIRPSTIVGKKFDLYYKCVGPFFKIRPFRYNNIYYISMVVPYGHPLEWHLIQKYTKDNTPTDVCYFIRVFFREK